MMLIHVVQPGESLYGIASLYGVTVEAVTIANQLNPSNNLVIGQALVIPVGDTYTVAGGDSLYRIGVRLGIDPDILARINNIAPGAVIREGQKITLPALPKRSVEVNAYAQAQQNGSFTLTTLADTGDHAADLTYLAPFSFEVNADGSLKPIDVTPLREAAAGSGAAFMLVVTNLENGMFSDTLGQTILNDEAVQNTLLDNIIATAQAGNYRDVHFDFEFLRPEDREAYNAFLRKAADRLHAQGLLMSTALAPKTSASQAGKWYEAHDYRVHGEVADFVVIMTYEWGYSAGPPLPVSPIGPVRQVLQYALTEIPADKIMMGQNLYGYDWLLPYTPGGEYARAISPQEAIALARDNSASIEYDYNAQAPFIRYWDRSRREHIVWFEDARSVRAKFELLRELNLRGISYWRLGWSFPQNWLLLGDRFDIEKREV